MCVNLLSQKKRHSIDKCCKKSVRKLLLYRQFKPSTSTFIRCPTHVVISSQIAIILSGQSKYSIWTAHWTLRFDSGRTSHKAHSNNTIIDQQKHSTLHKEWILQFVCLLNSPICARWFVWLESIYTVCLHTKRRATSAVKKIIYHFQFSRRTCTQFVHKADLTIYIVCPSLYVHVHFYNAEWKTFWLGGYVEALLICFDSFTCAL